MKLYDQIFNVVKQFKKLFSPGPVTNADVSGSITAEIFIIVSLVLSTILLRHVAIKLTPERGRRLVDVWPIIQFLP